MNFHKNILNLFFLYNQYVKVMKKNVKKNLMYLRKTLFDNTPIYAILLSDHPIKVRYSVSGVARYT